MGSLISPSIRRVAVVGGGPAGVTVAKYLLAERHFTQVDVFEQQSRLGGVWSYTPEQEVQPTPVPQTDPNLAQEEVVWLRGDDGDGKAAQATFVTPMYDGLESNIPSNLMRYSDDRSLEDDQLLPPRTHVVDYLERTAKGVAQHVHFQRRVTGVRLDTSGTQDCWSVETQPLPSARPSNSVYDAVVIANGHFSVPTVPDIAGAAAWNQAYPGLMTHSKHYRNPARYRGQKIVVIGSSASGTDIASQVSAVAKLPVYVSQRSESGQSYMATYKQMVPEIEEFLPPSEATRAVRFKDQTIMTDIDAVLFCTGFYYSCPFLTDLSPPPITSGERVEHLYQHLFYISHPSLAFMGLPSKILPFRTFEAQAAVIARVWSDRLQLPSTFHMSDWEMQRKKERGCGKSFHVLPYPEDMDYIRDMVDWASKAEEPGRGLLPPQFSEEERWQRGQAPLIKKAFIDRGEDRRRIRRVSDLGFVYQNGERQSKVTAA